MSRINLDQFAILSENAPSQEDVSYTTRIGYGYSIEAKQIRCSLEVSFKVGDDMFMTLKMSCEFKVQSKDWETFVSDAEICIPKSFMAHLAMHTIGTARGIIFCKTEGTPFSQFILPPVDAAAMVNEDIREPLPVADN